MPNMVAIARADMKQETKRGIGIRLVWGWLANCRRLYAKN